MKITLKNVLSVAALALASSCSPMYQVLETTSPDAKLENDNYVFENSELIIKYNLWTYGGKVSFLITNKTEQPIYIDWNKSHFIYNGASYEYWYDSEEAKSFYTSSSISGNETFTNAIVNVFGGSGYGTERSTTIGYKQTNTVATNSKYKPKQIIHIPPNSSIFVSKFSISNREYFSCEFPFRYSSSKNPVSKTFTKESSPLLFRNYLTYSVNDNFEQSKVVNNEFYISSVINMNQTVFKGKQMKEKYCSKSGSKLTKYFYQYPYKKPNAFFVLPR